MQGYTYFSFFFFWPKTWIVGICSNVLPRPIFEQKNIQKISDGISIFFLAENNLCILHGQVFVMY